MALFPKPGPRWVLAAMLITPLMATAQGSLTPPGAPAPSMKSLAQIEPRTPISTLPVMITNAGSYYLTTNLTGVPGTNGITVSANNVTLDLNGFALVGITGALAGISTTTPTFDLTVRNGTIRNWPSAGISTLATDARFEGLNVYSNNGSFAMSAGAHGNVRHCTVARNGAGLSLGAGSIISDCVIRHNGSNGISAGESVLVANCMIYGNTGNGLSLSNASSVDGCIVKTNGQNGVFGLANITITRCNLSQNNSNGVSLTFGGRVTDCVVSSNNVDGIRISARCTVSGNSCDFNGTTGIHAGIRATSSDNRIEENNLTSNINGIFSDNGYNLILRNKATLNTTNYSFHVEDIAGPSSANPSTAGPWANFTY